MFVDFYGNVGKVVHMATSILHFTVRYTYIRYSNKTSPIVNTYTTFKKFRKKIDGWQIDGWHVDDFRLTIFDTWIQKYLWTIFWFFYRRKLMWWVSTKKMFFLKCSPSQPSFFLLSKKRMSGLSYFSISVWKVPNLSSDLWKPPTFIEHILVSFDLASEQ